MSSSATDYSYHFGQAFANEVVEFGASNLAGLPCSVVFATIVFMLDTTLRSSTAKMYFVCGYLIELLLFYSIGTICFPPDTSSSGGQSDGEYGFGGSSNRSNFASQMQDPGAMFGGGSSAPLIHRIQFLARPFQHFTSASFFNFSAGYLLGYWGNLNILTETKNAVIVNAYYAAFVLFCFLLSVFYLNTASWQSGLVSAVSGIIGGMLCSSLIANRVKLEAGYDDTLVLRDPDQSRAHRSAQALPPGMTACDANSSDMVCKVFRASG